MDINRENYELGLPVIEKAGVAHKIEFKEGPALPVLDDMVADVRTFFNDLCVFCYLNLSSKTFTNFEAIEFLALFLIEILDYLFQNSRNQ